VDACCIHNRFEELFGASKRQMSKSDETVLLKRPADITFTPQNVILIEFKLENGGLVAENPIEVDIDCLPIHLSRTVPLLFAISSIKEAFGSVETLQYAVVIPNELNCYLVGCSEIRLKAEQLLMDIQNQNGFDTGWHWEIRSI